MDKTIMDNAEKYWNELFDCNMEYNIMYQYNRQNTKIYSNTYDMEKDLSNKILQLCKFDNMSIFTFFVTIVNLLLHQCYGAKVVSLGIPTYGYKDIRKLDNYVIPVIQCIEGKDSFYDILMKCKKTISDNYKYQFIKLDQIYSEKNIEKEKLLFNSIVAMTNLHEEVMLEEEVLTQKPELLFTIEKKEDKLFLILTCRHHEGAEEFLDLIYKMCERICFAVLENTSLHMDELSLIDEESLELYKRYNDTKTEYAEDNLIDIFKACVKKNKECTAVIYNNQSYSYNELNVMSNKFANYLRETGVQTGDMVALIAKPGIDMVMEVLGILKAGAAFLPIALEFPEDRIKYMLNDSKTKYLIINEELELEVAAKVIDVRDMDIMNLSNPELENEMNGATPAYVIYTSGTTGKPKGVMVYHKNIANSLNWRVKEYGFTPNDISLQLFSFVFDGFMTSFFTAILSGAKVVLMDQWDIKNPLKIAQMIEKEKVTALITVPTLYKSILRYADEASLKSLRKVTLVGERLDRDLVQKSKQLLSETEIINEYGPTENSVVTTIKRNVTCHSIITIGHPIANTRIYIVNQYGQLLPFGVKGEICIAGAGVVEGYLNKEDQTKLKFQKNNLNEEIMYHTSDTGKWLSNGEIEYLGRIDEQVKLRGLRIETAEIEQVLLLMEEIEQAIVVLDGVKEQLLAYVKVKTKTELVKIKTFLEKYLPDYMIPSVFYEIDKVPMTINGKINKRILSKCAKELRSEIEFVSPKTELEIVCTDIWKSLLKTDKISVHANFFEIGGYSLQLTMFLNEIYKRYGVDIPILQFFEQPTIKFACSYIENHKGEDNRNIEQAQKKEYYPMSDAQKRIYYVERMGNLGTAYNMPVAFIASPGLNYNSMLNALEQMIARHEILRTSFLIVDEKPVQKIHEQVTIEAQYDRWLEYSMEKASAFVAAFVRPFDMKKAPLIRFALIDLPKNRSLFILDMHHIISDGVSSGIMVQEMLALYAGKKLEKPDLQYKDYSEWLNNYDLSKQKKYWVEQFSTEEASLNLPTDYKRTTIRSYNGAYCTECWDENIVNIIKAQCAKFGATDYMVIMTYIMILVSKYSNQKSIIMGSPVSGRIHKDTENMLGMFVNTLPFRVDIASEDTFKMILKKVRKMCINNLNNQVYPVESLVSELKQQKDMTRNTLFDAMFVMNRDEDRLKIDGVEITPIELADNTSKYDLSISISVVEEKYQVGFQYCSDLFKQESILNMMKHLKVLIQNTAKDQDILVSKISMVDCAEYNKLVNEFNNSKKDYEQNKSVIDAFEEKVSLYKDRIAVVGQDRTLTYSLFNKQAGYAAHVLEQKGVCQGDYICVCMKRSVDMLAVIYGILKIGAVYVPVSPEYPISRIKYIIEDCNAKYMIVDYGQEKFDERVISMESNGEYDYVSSRVSNRQDVMYMIYTSGTTAVPKGVEVENHSIINILYDLQECYPMISECAYLFKTPASFDVSSTELFGWFFEGGRVIVLNHDDEKNPKAIAESIDKNQITHINFVPSMLNAFLSERKRKEGFKLNSLRYILVAGEELKSETANECMTLCPSAKVENLYGPTEATVYATKYSIANVDDRKSIPIGKPCANTKCFVVDSHNKLCGIGVPGELCIAGEGVSRGYKNKEGLTKERFIKSPFDKEDMMYRTGDYARVLSNGDLEYFGRIDGQVKIRGNRIEIGEIEEELLRIPGVDNAAVLVKDKGVNKVLHAFVASSEITVSAIKKELYLKLPSYMVPTYFSIIDKIPVSVNGKADKKKLALLKENIQNIIVYPKTDTQKRIVAIWKEVLQIEEIGIEDAFFDVGGDSILAILTLGKINKEFDIEYEIVDLFKYVTIEMLSEKIDMDISNSTDNTIEEFEF